MRRQLFSLVAGVLGVTMMAAPAFAQDQPNTNVTVNPPPAQQPAPAQPSTVIVQQPTSEPVESPVVVVPTPQQAAQQNETTTVTNSNVIVTGVMTFGVAYGIAAIAAASSDRSSDKRMYVPLLGPWLAMSDRGDCPVEQSSCDNETTDKILMAVDGVFQAVGVATAVYGVLSPVTVTHTTTSAKNHVHVVPVSRNDGHSAGLGIAGSF
jgi:hypothetical protein